MIKEAFGEKVRQLRKEKELTQGQLAEQSGLATRFVQELESGSKQPTLTTLYKLADSLNVTPGQLIDPTYKHWRREGKPEL